MQKSSPSLREIKEIIKNLEPESYRLKLIKSARNFKSNWVDLGEYLTKVASEKIFLQWGYVKFEDYCRLEIKIKKHTAIKLTAAYFFLNQEGGENFQGHDNEGLPDLDAVSVLQRAKLENNITPENYQKLKIAAFNHGQSGQTLNRKYKEMTDPDPEREVMEIKQSLSLVTRLQSQLKEIEGVPSQFSDYLGKIQDYLEKKE